MRAAILFSAVFGALGHSHVPEQVHLAFGHHTDSSMTVSWLTESHHTDAYVWYGTSKSDLDQTAHGSSSKYTYGDYESGLIHQVNLTDLHSDTVYYYQCGDDDATSDVFSFTTAPPVGDRSPVSFTVVGDLGQTKDSKKTLQHMIDEDSLAILHAGDLSYADTDQDRWDSWGKMVEPLSASRAWMMVAGNHEKETDSDHHAFTAYEARFAMPQVKPSTQKDRYNYNWGNSFYSFDVASLHVIMVNSYSDTTEGSEQYEWLKEDLKQANENREQVPWIVVITHNPIYNANTAHQGEWETEDMQKNMESVWYKYGVNLVLSGHVHAYQRSLPVYDGEVNDKAPTYIVIGDGGNREGHADKWQVPVPEWSAFRNGTQYGHGEVHLANETHMLWTWNRNVDESVHELGHVVADQAWIVNSATYQG